MQSDDYGYAQTGVILAELLGWPHATIIMQIEKTDSGIRVKRELEAGFFQFVDMPTPAVLTIQSGINKLRYATLIGIKQAKNKPLRKVSLAEVQSAIGENLQKIERLYVPQKTKKTEHIEGAPGGDCEEAGGQAAERVASAVSFRSGRVSARPSRVEARRGFSGKQGARQPRADFMPDTILVVVEQREGKLNRVSWETITAGQAIAAATGWTLEAAVVGGSAAAIAAEVAAKKVAKVYASSRRSLNLTRPTRLRPR